MVNLTALIAGFALTFSAAAIGAGQTERAPLDLQGYADAQGAISVQYKGDTVDPYFSMQALLLAHDNGMDTSAYALPWANWLVQRQKPDATFDRFCRNGPVWAACKTADADDSVLALWMRVLDTLPQQRDGNPVFSKSYATSQAALSRLIDPKRGIYLVSPVYQHGLFMDNLEVLSWHLTVPPGQAKRIKPTAKQLTNSIRKVFWDQESKSFLVSTQPEQKTVVPAFYPEHVAQILPLLFNFTTPGLDSKKHYRDWMRLHRATWLAQSKHDFSWGLLAIIALRAIDPATAACWRRETASARHTSHWIVTDEVARQILLTHNVTAAAPNAVCS